MASDNDDIGPFHAAYSDRSVAAEIFADVERVHADYVQSCDQLIDLLRQGATPEIVTKYISEREKLLQLTRKKLLALATAYFKDYAEGVERDRQLHDFVRAAYAYFDVVAGGRPTLGADRQTSYAAFIEVLQQLSAGEIEPTAAVDSIERCKQQLLRRSDEVVAAYAALRRSEEDGSRSARYGPQRLEADFVIVTMREDEFRAILSRFKPERTISRRRDYNVTTFERNGRKYTILTTRTFSQGNIEASNVVHDVLADIVPRCILFVGIAGARPDEDFTLGDVVISTHVQDYTLQSVDADQGRTYQVLGGPVDKLLLKFIVNLPAREKDIGHWQSQESLGIPRPSINSAALDMVGTESWKRRIVQSIEKHFRASTTESRFITGPIIASDTVVKDPAVLADVLDSSRGALAVEMESAGGYRVASENGIPFVAVRGVSDIVGLKRDDAWTKYACATAAAFTEAFISLGPLKPRN
jgi:nucleoside phosphorylase